MEKKIKLTKVGSKMVHYMHKYDGFIVPLCQFDAPEEYLVTKNLRKLTCVHCVELLLTSDRFFNQELDSQDFQ